MHYPIIVIIIIIVTIIIIILIIIIIIIIIIITATIQELPLLPAAYCSCVAIILAILLFQGSYYLIHRVATCLLEDILIMMIFPIARSNHRSTGLGLHI